MVSTSVSKTESPGSSPGTPEFKTAKEEVECLSLRRMIR
jgi:hypothetical protein